MKTEQRSYDDVIENLKLVPPGKSLQAITTAGGGTKVLSSAVMYVTGTSAELATRNGSLIKPGLEPTPGVTNFELADKLPKGQYIRMVAQRLLFETEAGKNQSDANWKSAAPVNWLNSDFEITQNGDGRLFKAPVTVLSSFKSVPTSNNDDFHYHEPVIIRPETKFDPKVTLAPGAVANQLWRWECIVQVVQDSDK